MNNGGLCFFEGSRSIATNSSLAANNLSHLLVNSGDLIVEFGDGVVEIVETLFTGKEVVDVLDTVEVGLVQRVVTWKNLAELVVKNKLKNLET